MNLTEAQAGLWYAQRLDPWNPIYNTGQYADIRGPLNLDAFRTAVHTAIAESDALAVQVIDSSYHAANNIAEPQVVIDEMFRARLQIVDLRNTTLPERAALSRINKDMSTPLDPSHDPMVAEILFVLGEDRHIWYQRAHHLVIDGYGVSLLTRRICELYAAAVQGSYSSGSPLGSFNDVLAEDAAYRRSSSRTADREFWLKQFEDRPDVAGMKSGLAITANSYHRHGLELPADFSVALTQLAESSVIAWPDIVVAVVAAYIGRHISNPEVVVGVPTMNRLGSASARIPAMTMNILPVRVRTDSAAGDIPLNAFLAGMAQQLIKARRHGKYRSEQLRRDLNLLGEQRRLYGPLINVLPFSYSPALPDLTASLHTLGTGAVDDLTVTVRGDASASRLWLELDANPDLYDEAEVVEHANRLAAFLNVAVKSESLSAVPTLTPAEHQRWVYEVNNSAHPVEDTTLTALIERTMQRVPDAAAVTFGPRTLSYAELEQETARLARRLSAAGVRRGDIVAVGMPRSMELVVALVAILRTGAAYLPIDLDHPRGRITSVLDSANPRTAITFDRLRDLWPGNVPLLILDRNEENSDSSGRSMASPEPHDAAYVIYTSGSTGTPKGVVIEHKAIVNRLEWMRTNYAIAADDRILQKTPITFDVSVWELFLPLIAGAHLVVAPPDAHKDPQLLASIFREYHITTAHFVPSMMAEFLSEPSAAGIEMRRVFCSGEELSAPLRDRFHQVMRAELHNLYGPTEAAVDVSYSQASASDRSAPVPIGFPVWNTMLYVLDSSLKPVPPGVTGDLFIGGIQLAREYLGRPDLTAERFIEDPFAEGGRMYRTGDVARRRRDGSVVFLGRSDHQIKIRGLRIELGEIEAAIASFGAIGRSLVIAREDRPGDLRIAAYMMPAQPGVEINLDSLRAHVADKVPDYMIPSSLTVLSEFPITSNGKLDRAALPRPKSAVSSGGRSPETSTELKLTEFFEDILGANVNVDDDFFLHGGHSLSAVRLVNRVREHWHCEISLGVLFANPTVARLAAYVDMGGDFGRAGSAENQGTAAIIPLLTSRNAGAGAKLFCVHPAGGISWCYTALARALGEQWNVYGVQARGLDLNQATPERLTEMAGDYVDRIRDLEPQGPYRLLGWSVGGIIAQAMAVRLRALGAEVELLAMLDSYPSDCWRNEAAPDESMALRALIYIAGHDPAALGDAPLTRQAVIDFLRRSGHPLGELSDDALTGIVRVTENNSAMVRNHYHERFDGTILYFRAAHDHQNDSLSPLMWEPYVGAIEQHEIPALHAQMVGSTAVNAIARVMKTHL